MVQYKDHSEWATFHITSISQTMIILGHMWLMEHNPEIDWCMGDITMTRCLASCRLKTTDERDWLNCVSADKTQRQLKSHLHQQVHMEEVPESQPTCTRTKPPPGFACPDLDEWDRDNPLLVQFIGAWPEEIRATQTISQKLAEALGGASLTRFEDTVPKPYQEF